MARNRTVGYSPTASPTKSRWTTAGIGAVLITGLLVGAFFLGIATAPDVRAPEAGAAGLSMRDAIPVPDRHSVAGAATAAQNFQIAGFRVGAGTLDPRAATRVLLASEADASAKKVLAAPTADPAQLAKIRTSFAPASVMVVSYTAERAEVQVWGVAASSSQLTPQPGGTETWGRTLITLSWDGAQWGVLEQHYDRGPWPVRSDSRLTDADGNFDFRFSELPQHGWSYVPEP